MPLIDPLWLKHDDSGRAAGAFDVEDTTPVYSGIVGVLDLAPGAPAVAVTRRLLFVPDDRQTDVRAQLALRALSRAAPPRQSARTDGT